MTRLEELMREIVALTDGPTRKISKLELQSRLFEFCTLLQQPGVEITNATLLTMPNELRVVALSFLIVSLFNVLESKK